ncbi:MAG TPA: hypothetical protein VFM09_09315 [Marmoricola sp.]|nr:hypothetical protein [Marmoricola sp.]
MRATYRFLAYAIPVLVAVQAAAIAFAFFGLGAWIEDGHRLTKATIDSHDTKFVGDLGFMVHSIDGEMLIPLVALLLLVVSFFAKVPGGSRWAAFVLLDVVLQVLLAFVAFGAPVVGMLHGLNALFLAWLGWSTARRTATAGELAGQPAVAPTVQPT